MFYVFKVLSAIHEIILRDTEDVLKQNLESIQFRIYLVIVEASETLVLKHY